MWLYSLLISLDRVRTCSWTAQGTLIPAVVGHLMLRKMWQRWCGWGCKLPGHTHTHESVCVSAQWALPFSHSSVPLLTSVHLLQVLVKYNTWSSQGNCSLKQNLSSVVCLWRYLEKSLCCSNTGREKFLFEKENIFSWGLSCSTFNYR